MKAFIFVHIRGWRFLFLLFFKLKIFTLTFECWRFLLILLDVEGSYFYFLMFKVIALTLECLKFLLLVLNVESFCFYFWILKVFAFVLGCWRFLLLFLNVEGSYFYFWMLKVCDSWYFVYLHILKKMMWKYIPFYLEVDCTILI